MVAHPDARVNQHSSAAGATRRRAGYISGASLASRALSAALLIVAAHTTSVAAFGVLAVVIGLAVSLAGVMSSGYGDIIAAATYDRPWAVRRACSALLICVGVSAFLIPLPLILDEGIAAWSLGGLTLAIHSVGALVSMQVLRGSGRSLRGATHGYITQPLFRLLGAVILTLCVGGGPLDGGLFLVCVNAGGVLSAGVALSDARRSTGGSVPSRGTRSTARTAYLGVFIGLAYLVLTQADITILGAISGARASGEYAPQLRAFEALTAFSIGFKFVNTRAIMRDRVVPKRMLMIGIVAPYLLGAALLLVLGPFLLPIAFGAVGQWSWARALIMTMSYLFASLAAVRLQVSVAAGKRRELLVASGLVIFTVPIVGVCLIEVWGSVGAALMNFYGFVVWWFCLRSSSKVRK